jgi:transposase
LRLSAKESGNLARTARELGIRRNMLERWRNELNAHEVRAFPGSGRPTDEETARLQRENARLREENEILKKAIGVFSKSPR